MKLRNARPAVLEVLGTLSTRSVCCPSRNLKLCGVAQLVVQHPGEEAGLLYKKLLVYVQESFGKCEESWMVSGGYCDITCGRCGSGGLSSTGAIFFYLFNSRAGAFSVFVENYDVGSIG